MSAGAPSKYCPRCNTVLPLQSPFCGNCGYQFNLNAGSAPQGANYGSNYGPAQYVGQNAPGGWPQGQPGYPPPGQPGFGYQASPPKKKGGAGKIIALLLVLVIVGGGAAAWFLYLSPSKCSGPLFDAHGVPSTVPLPSGCTFNSQRTQTDSTSGATGTIDQWIWTVNGPNDPTTVAQFYKDKLPGSNWTNVKETSGENGSKSVIGCQGQQAVEIVTSNAKDAKDFNQKPLATPPGGSLLGISIITAKNAKAQLELQVICSGNTPSGGVNP